LKEENLKFVGLFICVLALWALGPIVLINLFSSWEVRGQFGDLFGSTNALFSGLAFAGLIYTIYLQKNELALQREELRLQREEMAASRAELANQGVLQEKQYLATLTELRVQAAGMEVEALKMEAEMRIPSARHEYYQRIREQADKVEGLVCELERG
ncbi:hypothetical protein ACUT7I_003458, partial [Vibrio cholerae]